MLVPVVGNSGLRSRAVDGGIGLGMNLAAVSPVLRDQSIEIVTVRSVRAEGLLIKQTFDPTTQADLIRMILKAHRPTHLAMPAAAEDHDSGRSQTCGNYSERPTPTRLLFLLTHLPQPVSPSNG